MKHGVEFESALGERSLEIAAKLGEFEVAKELIEWGAHKDAVGVSGQTPFGNLLSGALFSEFFDMRNFATPGRSHRASRHQFEVQKSSYQNRCALT